MRCAVRFLAVAGVAALSLAGLQFGRVPWRLHAFLAGDGTEGDAAGDAWTPTHILVLGGSGVPGESALMRLWYAAEAALANPEAPVWLALPCRETDRSDPAAAAYARELCLRKVPPERCLPRACGNNTHEQAENLVRALSEDGAPETPRVLLVTSPEHVRRACLAARRAARDAGFALEIRGLPAENLSLEDHGVYGPASPSPGGLEEAAPPPDAEGSTPGESFTAWRYDFWNHARYTLEAAREFAAMAYYRFKGWI